MGHPYLSYTRSFKMYDNLKPTTINPKEAKQLVTMVKKGLIKIIPQKCCVLLIKGPMTDEFLMGLARKYKDSAWIAPRQNEITYKILLDVKTRDFFNGISIFTEQEIIEKFAGKIYTTGIIFIRLREKERMLKGLSYIRIADVNMYFKHTEENDDAVATKTAEMQTKVTDVITKGFALWTKLAEDKNCSIDDLHYAVIRDDVDYGIYRKKDEVAVFETKHIFDFLYTLYTYHQKAQQVPASDETCTL